MLLAFNTVTLVLINGNFKTAYHYLMNFRITSSNSSLREKEEI